MICDECVYAHRCGEEAQATAAQRGDCVSATDRDQAEASQPGGVRLDSSSAYLIKQHTHPPQTTQTSLEAMLNHPEEYRRESWQRIIAVLSDRIPRTRERIQVEAQIHPNSIRLRLNEIQDLWEVCGVGRTQSGTRAELIRLRENPRGNYEPLQTTSLHEIPYTRIQ